ncbi:MAG: hypothetical protein ACLQEQ_00525 [Nitrososphaerales archaeon]
MVRRGIFFLAVFDLLVLTFLYFVLQDLAWRASYVTSEHFSPSTTYSLFIHTFSITVSAVQPPLVSPPALDWVQVGVATLILINGFYVFQMLRR